MTQTHNTHRHFSTLSIGGATHDVFVAIPPEGLEGGSVRLKAGAKIPVERIEERPGGGACNTAVALARLGCSSSFCGVVGSDAWGEALLSAMKKEGVSVAPATIVEGETGSFSIILSLPTGERTILHHSGANAHLHDATFDKNALMNVDAVFLNHLCERACIIQDDIIDALTKRADLKLAWNPGGSQLHAGFDEKNNQRLLRHTALLLLNKEEALRFTRAEETTNALQILHKAGSRMVCITDGPHGVIATDGTHIVRCPAVRNVPIVDATGAGDAFGSAALWALLQGFGLQEIVIFGTMNATTVIGSVGAQTGLMTAKELLAADRSALRYECSPLQHPLPS
jgi:sugar/nucleoside kinase (ribokinase family)